MVGYSLARSFSWMGIKLKYVSVQGSQMSKARLGACRRRSPVIEQDAVLQITDDNSFGQVEQDCFEPALLLLGTLRGGRDGRCRPAARCSELLRQLLDGTRKPFEGVAGRHQQPATLLGHGQRFRFARQDLDGSHDPQVKNGP